MNKKMELDGFVRPRTKIQSEIMQATTSFKNSISKARFPTPNFVFDNSVTFDPTNRMFDPNP